MKSALMSVGAFAVAMALTTVISVSRAPLPELPVDALALADSLLADSLWRDSVTSRGEDETPMTPTRLTTFLPFAGNPEMSPNPAGQEVGAAITVDTTDGDEALQTLAQVFARMTPQAAAQIMQHMSDAEVEGVVRNLGSRQAASVLSNLPEQRAAVLARRLMEGRGENN